MSSRKRAVDDKDKEQQKEPPRARLVGQPSKSTSLFALELDKNARSMYEYYNQHLKEQVLKNPLNQPPRADGAPVFQYWNLVAEYCRAMREVDLRFAGPVGTIYCHGSNDMFQQGLPDLIDKDEQDAQNFVPHQLGVPLDNVRQVRAGGTSLGALTKDGKIYTWGSSDEGVLGRKFVDIDTTKEVEVAKAQATPLEVTEFQTVDGHKEYEKITQFDIGNAHMMFLTIAGNVYFCGAFKDGDSLITSPPDPHFVRSGEAPPEPPYNPQLKKDEQPEQPDTYGITGHRSTPIHLKMFKNCIAVFSGGNFAAVLDGNRQLWTFGFGNSGELARSQGMVAPSADGKYNLMPAVYKNKNTPSYGWFDMKMLHDKFLTPSPVRFQIPTKKKVMHVACGDIHMLVTALEDGSEKVVRLYSAGHNQYGQLGLGDQESRHALTLVPFFDDKKVVGHIAAGGFHSLALTAVGDALYSWGRSDTGQLGIGSGKATETGQFFNTPQRVPMPPGVLMQQVGAGENMGMVLTIDDELYTWGFEGTTGHGGKYLDEDLLHPRKIEMQGANRFHSMDGGSQHGIFLASFDQGEPEQEAAEEKPQPKKKRRVG